MSQGLLLLVALATYFMLLAVISRRTKNTGGNDDFFRGGRVSSWGMVAFGMIGASVSGVSLVSVPGWVGTTHMTYLQMCLGFVLGYFIVAFVLLPLYYRLRLTSIYSFLGLRFGERTHRIGALFFILSKLTGAAARLYLATAVMAAFLPWKFAGAEVVVAGMTLVLIHAYTARGGIKTLVRTDVLQTACMLVAIASILWAVNQHMPIGQRGIGGMVDTLRASPLSQIFEWDWRSPQAFWRQLLSGAFIVVVMTGLDQDMMQKNLTCRTLRDAQKDMCSYGLAFVPVNALLLMLGVLLYSFCASQDMPITTRGDSLLPTLMASGTFGDVVIIPFVIGIVAAAFSSADSAITSLTTSICVDLFGMERHAELSDSKAETVRRQTHIGVTVICFLCIVLFGIVNSTSVIDAIYTMAAYTYGPLLGLFSFGLFTKRIVSERAVPWIAVASPVICALLDHYSPILFSGYTWGYELLLLNGTLVFSGLWTASARKSFTSC